MTFEDVPVGLGAFMDGKVLQGLDETLFQGSQSVLRPNATDHAALKPRSGGMNFGFGQLVSNH